MNVSAVIPCFNGAEWLAEAIESIQRQSVPVGEIIVVDDCSTDQSAEIAKRMGAVVVRNAVNSGEGYSRNHGTRRASGEFIASLDADDLWMPHHVETLTGLFRTYPEATAAFAAVQRFGLRDELVQGYIPPGAPVDVFWLAFNDWLHTTIGSMVRRDALLEIGGFDEKERYSVDYDLWLRLSRGRLFVCTHEVTSLWRWHDKNQSTNRGRQIEAVYRFRESYIEQEQVKCNSEFLQEADRRLITAWRRDTHDAWKTRDLRLLRYLCSYARRHGTGISKGEWLHWTLKSMIPEGLMAARDRRRGRDRQVVG